MVHTTDQERAGKGNQCITEAPPLTEDYLLQLVASGERVESGGKPRTMVRQSTAEANNDLKDVL